MKRGCFIAVMACLSASAAFSTGKQVLLLGDEVLFSYKADLIELIGDTAVCTFVGMPETGKPDWDAFCEQHVYGKGYDVIHFSYGRELMVHEGGRPRAAERDIWGIYTGLIKALQKSGAFLIGCTTTPVRGSMAGYESGVDWTYGSRFKQQLGPHGVKVNELGDYTLTRASEMIQNNSNLPTELGARLMAEQVANSILEAFNEGQDVDRPRILLVGDSIVGGYYSATRDLFAGRANVFTDGTTYNDTAPDWAKIVDRYIEKGGERGWDVIQFNWGLHAVKFVDEQNRNSEPGAPGAHIQFSIEEYARNLERFVCELKRANAELVFATTTPIPEGASDSIRYIDLTPYNDAAKEIMKRHDVTVNDLYSFVSSRDTELQLPNNVHFTAYGSEELAKRSHAGISSLLKELAGRSPIVEEQL